MAVSIPSDADVFDDWFGWLREQSAGLYPGPRFGPPVLPPAPPCELKTATDCAAAVERRLGEMAWVEWATRKPIGVDTIVAPPVPDPYAAEAGAAFAHLMQGRKRSKARAERRARLAAKGRAKGTPKAQAAAAKAKRDVTASKITPVIRADIERMRNQNKWGLASIVRAVREKYDVRVGRNTVDNIAKAALSPSGT